MRRRWMGLALSLCAAFLTACSATPLVQLEEPKEVAIGFVKNYDHWAQEGYTDPIPDDLREVVSSDMLDVLKDDQSWYLTGGIQQHGQVKIVKSEVDILDESHAVVTVTLDASSVTVTAEGQETWVDYSRPIVTHVKLERTTTWKVVSTESAD